jgi:hypothetical protein
VPRGTHSLEGEGAGGANSDEGTDTLRVIASMFKYISTQACCVSASACTVYNKLAKGMHFCGHVLISFYVPCTGRWGGGGGAKNHVVVRLLVCEVGGIAAHNMITITLLLH